MVRSSLFDNLTSSPDTPPPSGTSEQRPDSGTQDAHRYTGLNEPASLLRAHPAWLSYLFALIMTAAAIGLRRWLDFLGDDIVPFAIFYPTVLVCTLVGGAGPGFVSLALSAFAAIYLWVEPQGIFAMHGAGLINFFLFVLTSAIVILLAQRLRITLDRLGQSEARLTLAQEVGRIGIWDLDLKTGALWWSPSLYKVTGISPDSQPSVEAIMERIDPADRGRTQEAFDIARRGLDRLDIDFRFNRDDGSTVWLAIRAELFRDSLGRPSRLLGINFDTTPIRTAVNERDRANSLLQTFFESLPGAAFAKDLEGRYLLGNPVFATAIGHPPESFLGKRDDELFINKDHANIIMTNDRAVIDGGKACQIEEALRLSDGDMAYWLAVKAPFFDAGGNPQGIIGISLDVTERRKAEERLRFLADEVDHRAKNLLGVVLSLVRLTKVDDVAAFKAAVSGRIEALARAHTLLAANRWQGVNIATLMHEEIAPFGEAGTDRIRLDGPPLILAPNASQAFAMAVHELAINAAMYGALSTEAGRLDVSWQLIADDAGESLALDWRESGGPSVQSPSEPGFGSTAIQGAIEHQLGGCFDIQWAATGLTCRFVFPLSGNMAGDHFLGVSRSGGRLGQYADGSAADLCGKRVMVVEDEALIALTLMDAVRESGGTVIGPAGTVAAAIELARKDTPDLAILDVDLAGTGSAPVARALRSLGVPFVYCTGYAETAVQIEPELRAAMLTKPIDSAALEVALREALNQDAPFR